MSLTAQAVPKLPAKRSFIGQTTQVEAIPPRWLREIVVDAIEERIDHETYNAIIEREASIRESLAERLEDL